MVEFDRPDPPLLGRHTSPFVGEGKARVKEDEKEKNEREKKVSRVVESLFPFMRV